MNFVGVELNDEQDQEQEEELDEMEVEYIEVV